MAEVNETKKIERGKRKENGLMRAVMDLTSNNFSWSLVNCDSF